MAAVETKEYRMSRNQLVYWSAYEYVRRFWPAFIAFPVSGLMLMLFMRTQLGIGLGMLMILWPMSIPARSVLFTGKAAKRVLSPTKMHAEGKHVFFDVNPPELSYRVHVDSVRDVLIRTECVVIELWKFKLIYIPRTAFESKDEIQKLREFCGV